MTPSAPVDALVIGGGPAGSAIGRLLASWGHSVIILDKSSDPARGLAESLPPSTTKLLTHIGVHDAVERAAFYRTRGNTVWWASRERRVETFGPDAGAFGYQVFRPAFDRVMLDSAAAAGASVERGVHVRAVHLDGDASDEFATVEYESAGRLASARRVERETPISAASAISAFKGVRIARARYVIDCSGRVGVIGRRYRTPQPEFRTYALVGVWRSDLGWDLPDPTHTVVETFADGWVWSVPVDETTRHVGAMVGHALPEPGHGGDLTATYRALLAKAPQTASLVEGAALERMFACDASLYSATQYAGPRFLLVGDAGSFIDPLSSYGVKKALASAWLGAIAVHTALAHPERRELAFEFFSARERQMYAAHLQRSRAFAREADAEHPDGFWSARAGTTADAQAGDDLTANGDDEPAVDLAPQDVARDPAVRQAFERFRSAPDLHLVLAGELPIEARPVVRGRVIVLEPALAGGLRFFANVDLLKLAQIAPSYRHVPEVFEAYCRSCPAVPLPSVLGGLSLLVARGILHERT